MISWLEGTHNIINRTNRYPLLFGGRKEGFVFHRLVGCSVMLGILVLRVPCTRLGEPAPGEQNLAMQELTQADSIHATRGKLVCISGVPAS